MFKTSICALKYQDATIVILAQIVPIILPAIEGATVAVALMRNFGSICAAKFAKELRAENNVGKTDLKSIDASRAVLRPIINTIKKKNRSSTVPYEAPIKGQSKL
uniref:Uncharacterized protein n=1 Tax=Glossina austeni TaxID=7395 RepID=A0A1A9VLJ4_GLOAU